MPRKPSSERFVVGNFAAEAAERAGWIAINHEQAMPSRFVAEAQLLEPPCTVSLEARLDVSGEILVKKLSVEVPLPGAAAITTTNLRSILVAQLVRESVKELAKPIEMLPDFPKPSAYRLTDGPRDEVWVSAPQPKSGRGRETPRDRIVRAAAVYREAVSRGSRSPVKDVARELGYSESQTSRYLKAARAEGMLDDVAAPMQGGHRKVVGYVRARPA